MSCSFRGRRSALDVSIVIFRGRRSILDVACWVFLQIALAGLRQVATSCKFCGRRGILWDALKIDGSLARNIDFEVANLEVPKKTRRKTSILRLQSVKIGGSLARNACFGAPTRLVSSLWFSCGFAASPCLWGKPQDLSFSKVSKQVVMSFCVAGVALCDVPTCLITCRKCQNWRMSLTKCLFFCIHVSRLESLVFLWLRRVYGGSRKTTLYTLHFYTLHTPYSTLYTPHSTLYTPHSTLYTFHFPLSTPHSTLYTPHSTLYTLHFTLLTLHSTLYTFHSTLHTPHFTLYTLHSALLTLHSTLHTLHSPLHTPHSTLYTPHFTLYTPHSTLSTPRSALYTLYSTLHTLHSTLYTLHFTGYTPHSTLQTGNRGNMYKTVQINYCRKVFCVIAYPCVLTSVPLTYVWAFGFVGCILFFAQLTSVPRRGQVWRARLGSFCHPRPLPGMSHRMGIGLGWLSQNVPQNQITDYPWHIVTHSNLLLSWDIQNACSLSRRIGWDIHEQTWIFL